MAEGTLARWHHTLGQATIVIERGRRALPSAQGVKRLGAVCSYENHWRSMSTIEPPDDTLCASAAPLATMLLITFQQSALVREAIHGALAQTWSPLEIVISDDASTDDTWAQIGAAVAGYAGPHRIVLNRNAVNLGIGAHLTHVVGLSHGEMLFIAAGDDVSLPQRCERVMREWLVRDCRPDLIATALTDIDAEGRTHGTLHPTDLSTYRNAADWLARPPYVVGAAQAWTRRVFERYGPLPAGVVGEDLIMVFRAIGAGGAFTLAEPLVKYRRGGVSRRVRNLSAHDVVRRAVKSSGAALAELPQLLADALTMGQLPTVQPTLERQLARARFVHALFAVTGFAPKLRLVLSAGGVPWGARLRFAVYALCPWLLAPAFLLKRLFSRERGGP